ncbi:MAG: plasmid replication initiator TrfA [Agitococcus sp.]|nr:plasmid replication initiator TrfA [Agitococcus sp.]MDO9177144.1 plasmid replication initiator TrfA [Agitococcus sp.]
MTNTTGDAAEHTRKAAQARGKSLMERTNEIAKAAKTRTAKRALQLDDAPAAQEQLQLELPKWADDTWGMPNSFARGSLFTAMKATSGTRMYYENKRITALAGINMEFRGQELRQDDYSVFLAMLHFGRNYTLGAPIPFTAYSMLKELGWSINSDEYAHLRECCSRLSATNVTVTHDKASSKGYAGSLLRSFAWRDETGKQLSSWVALLEPNIAQLFSGPTFSLIDSSERKKIGGRAPLAQWLHSFLATHQKPLPISISKYWELSASRCKDINDFRRRMKMALTRLVEVGFLKEFVIQGDLVYVNRVPKSFKNPNSDMPDSITFS